MATTILETFGVIRSDGTLELEQKLAVLPGRVKVRVESMPEAENAEDLARRFAELTATWKEGTRFTSKIKTMREHPAYREIVAMGKKAVPLILASIEKEPHWWFLALPEINGGGPTIPVASRGKLPELVALWIKWGREQGYRW